MSKRENKANGDERGEGADERYREIKKDFSFHSARLLAKLVTKKS